CGEWSAKPLGERMEREASAERASSSRGTPPDTDLLPRPRPVVVQTEQSDDAREIALIVNVVTHPTRVWINVMRLGPARSHQLISDQKRKRQVRKPVAVQVSQLSASEPELRSAKTVRSGGDAGPTRYFSADGVVNAFPHDSPLLFTLG